MGGLSRMVEAAAGEAISIAKAGKPVVRRVPIENPPPPQPGIGKGRVTDAFFEPLPEQELSAWEA